jgi:hypothetical protein
MEHTIAVIYTHQKKVLKNTKQHLSSVKKVIYFMDVAASTKIIKNNNLAHNKEYHLRSRILLLHCFSWKEAVLWSR